MEIKQKKAGLCPWLQPCLKACMLASQAPCLGGGPGFPGSQALLAFPQGGRHWFQGASWPPCSCLAMCGACRQPAQSRSRDPGLVGPPSTGPWRGLSCSKNAGGATCIWVTCEPTATVTRTDRPWSLGSGGWHGSQVEWQAACWGCRSARCVSVCCPGTSACLCCERTGRGRFPCCRLEDLACVLTSTGLRTPSSYSCRRKPDCVILTSFP